MKPPKIGDIVLYHGADDRKVPAVVMAQRHVFCCLFVMHPETGTSHERCGYSTANARHSWSWPEEDPVCTCPTEIKAIHKLCPIHEMKQEEKPKECTHNYQDEFLLKCPPLLQKVCQKCRHVREEKQEECEHDWNGEDSTLNRMVCWDCGAKFLMQKPQSKAEELIEKIFETIKNGEDPQYSYIKIEKLIKEYKGI